LKDRLDTIIANLFFGLILVFFTMRYLISTRTAIIVSFGVPVAFIIGLLFIYYAGFSLNLVSLIGALITVGIVVDDAIIVSENIQRHLDDGMEAKKAVLEGVKEIILPVTIATLTTIIAFLPMLTLSAEIGRFIFLIPVAVILILLGSFIESFIFLPLHAKSLLKPKEKHFNWEPIRAYYFKSLHFFIFHKKRVIIGFFVTIPLLTLILITSMKFQFFPRFDGRSVYLSAKLDINSDLDQTQKIALALEQKILKHKEELSIKAVSTVVGWRRNLQADSESGENLFYMEFELFDIIDENWINRIITPILSFSFDFNDPEKIRTLHAYEVSKKMRTLIKPYEKEFPLDELGVTSSRVGLLRSDIKIDLVGSDDKVLEKAVKDLQEALKGIKGVKDIGNNIKYGKKEIELRPNDYGLSLGLTEQKIALMLNAYYLTNMQSMSMGSEGVIEIVTRDQSQSELESFKAFELPLENGQFVRLDSVCDLSVSKDYEKIEKSDGEIIKSVFANVELKEITANEVLENLEETLEGLEKNGIRIILKGEAQKNNQFKSEISFAIALALIGILLVLMLVFPKIKYALMILGVIPMSVLGALFGHLLLGMNLTMPSIVGILGLAGVVINDGILMLSFLQGTHEKEAFFERAGQRLRPILITTITTFVGLATLMFYATGQAVILQPIAVSLGFGLIWGTILNLYLLPTLYAFIQKIKA
ncbi:MAG: efflux RND transporter permease subunit, partial [Thiovulaceae bacterium]|nr:efflux RND transporter permease subunit [Sulfurimonadaceae bacterium]